mgnify:CR=1 FL=1
MKADVKQCGEVTPFDVPRRGRDSARVIEQAGNSMPVPLIAVALLYCWGITDVARPKPQSVPRLLSASGSSSCNVVMPSNPPARRRLLQALSLSTDDSGSEEPQPPKKVAR